MRVRKAAPADAGAVAAIWNHYIRHSAATFTNAEKTPEALAAEIMARGGLFLVAEAAGEITGFATAFPFRAGPGYRHTLELTLHMAPQARGRGGGRALIGALERAAEAAGAHVLVAAVSAENPDGIGFHRAMGYAEAGRLMQVGAKFGRWMDLVLMQKILTPGAVPR